MSLTWPWGLAALLAVPLLLLLRWWLNRRRRRLTVQVSSVALIRAALPGRSLWRRRIPVLLFLAGLLALGGAVARPQASVAVPADDTSIMLALDVSRSMCSTDVEPNRLSAAVEAARGFVRAQADGSRVGLVAFSGIAGLMVEPTTDQDALLAALDELTTARGTAIGHAILTAIDAIAEHNTDVAPTGVGPTVAPSTPPAGTVDYEPDTIVVLTDGANTTGIDPVVAAEQAAARRVRVFTIGFGTTQPTQMVCTPEQISGNPFAGDGGFGGYGGFRGGGMRRFQLIDEPTLTRVAELTGGKYFRAEDSEQLVDVMTKLPREFGLRLEDREITAWFLLPGALLVLCAVFLSLWWNRTPALAPSRGGGAGVRVVEAPREPGGPG
jgi:Ca-activated chloride channel family protein